MGNYINDLNDLITAKSEIKNIIQDTLNENPSEVFSYYPSYLRTIAAGYGGSSMSEDEINAYIAAYLSSYNFIDQDTLSANSYLTSVPSEFITQDELSAMGYLTSVPEVDLSSYVTYSYADNKYFGRLEGISGSSDGNVISSIGESFDAGASVRGIYYQKTYVPSYAYIESYYATKSYVADYVNTYSPTPDLSSYVTKDELSAQSYLTQHQDLSGYVSKQELSSAGYITSIPNDYATYAAINGMAYITMADVSACGYLTQHQDLSSYASKSYVADYVATYAPVPDLSSYALKTDLNSYVSKTELSNAGYITSGDVASMGYITSIPSEYITDSELSACGYLTQHQDLSSYVSKTELSNCGYITSASIPTQVKADWNQTNSSNASYIQNKPEIKGSQHSLIIGSSPDTNIVQSGGTGLLIGQYNKTGNGLGSIASGLLSYAIGAGSIAVGIHSQTNNYTEATFGKYNQSNTASSAFGNAGNTHFSIGIGAGSNEWDTKNAIEIMQNGDMYAIGVGNYDGTNYTSSKTVSYILNYLQNQISGQSVPDLSSYVSKTELSNAGYITSIPSEYVTDSELSACGYLTAVPNTYPTYVAIQNMSYATQSYVTSKLGDYYTQGETDGEIGAAVSNRPTKSQVNGMFSWDSTTQTLTITTIS